MLNHVGGQRTADVVMSQACRLTTQHPRAAFAIARDLSGCTVTHHHVIRSNDLALRTQITGVPTRSTSAALGVGQPRVWGCWRRTLRSGVGSLCMVMFSSAASGSIVWWQRAVGA